MKHACTTSSRLARSCAAIAALSLCAAVGATPVEYTLRTVADGRLGDHVFSQALVTLRLASDTTDVVTQAGSLGGTLYTNNAGTATVTVTDGNRTFKAKFWPGEIYVRYDAGAGIAGFGSAISPFYPIVLGCDDYAFPSAAGYVADCTQGDWGPLAPYGTTYGDGTANALALLAYYAPPGVPPNPLLTYSAQLQQLPANLSQSTVLSGRIHACAALYTVGTDLGGGNLQVCSGPAPHGLRTDHGGFYLQDMVGGSLQPADPGGLTGWSVANYGSLQVEAEGP